MKQVGTINVVTNMRRNIAIDSEPAIVRSRFEARH